MKVSLFTLVLFIPLIAFSQVKSDNAKADTYYTFADSLFVHEKYDSAIIFFTKAQYSYEKVNLWERVASCHNKVSESHLKLLQYDLGIKEAEEALTIISTKKIAKSPEEGFAHLNIGNALDSKNEYDEAIKHMQLAMDILKSRIERVHVKNGDVNYYMGVIYYGKKNYKVALNYLQRSLTIYKEIFKGELNKKVADNFSVIGIQYDEMGDKTSALNYYRKSLGIYNKISGSDKSDIAGLLINMGAMSMENGEYELGLEYYQRSLALLQQQSMASDYLAGIVYLNTGNIYAKLEKGDLALESYEKALPIIIKTRGDKHPAVIYYFNNVGGAYTLKKDFAKAMESYEKALALKMQVFGKNHLLVASTFMNIADLHLRKKEYDQAINFYNKAISIDNENQLDKNPHKAMHYNGVAEAYKENGDYDKALDSYSTSMQANVFYLANGNLTRVPPLAQCNNRIMLLKSLRGKAETNVLVYKQHSGTKNLTEAIKTYQMADTLIDRIRHAHKKFNDKAELSTIGSGIYEGAVESCLLMNGATQDNAYMEQAFYFSEKNKAGILTDVLSDISAKSFGLIPDKMLALEKELAIEKSFYQSKIMESKTSKDGYDTSLVRNYESNLFSLNHRSDSLTVKLESDYPDYYELKYENKIAHVKNLQNGIPSGSLLLEYFEGDSTMYVFAISKNKFTYKQLKKDSIFEKSWLEFMDGLKNRHKAKYALNGYYLYNNLLEEVLSEFADVERLIIIPDGRLTYLPFECLIQSQPAIANGYKSFNYVLNDYEVSYHYSASLYTHSVGIKNNGKTFLGFAPAMVSNNNILPRSEEEVLRIASLLHGDVSTGGEATEFHFKNHVTKYGIVHLASHAEVNDKNPLFSKLYFTSKGDTLEDGILHTHELYNLSMNANLVTLSACNTGVGNYQKGEGMMSLARGFMYAGVPNLLTSMWKVSDQPTKDIMLYFYEELNKGVSYSSALRKAKLRFIMENDNITADPYYWSSFIMIGNPNADMARNNWILIYSLIPLAVTLVYFLARNVKRKRTE